MEEISPRITDWCFSAIYFAEQAELGEISPKVIKTSKYVYLFCYLGGLGEISPMSCSIGK